MLPAEQADSEEFSDACECDLDLHSVFITDDGIEEVRGWRREVTIKIKLIY